MTECKEIEDHLLQINRQHLRQAADTPFAEGISDEMIDWDGSGELVDRLVKGEPLPDMAHLSETCIAYMKGMLANKIDTIDAMDMDLILEKYRHLWKCKRENTATSPFGLHIGHYKSVLGEDKEDILEVHQRLRVIPCKYGFVLNRWAHTVQLMIQKDEGEPRTNRLRIVDIF